MRIGTATMAMFSSSHPLMAECPYPVSREMVPYFWLLTNL